MLLQSDLNKWNLSQLAKLYQLCINYASTIIVKRSRINLIESKDQIFPNNSHIYLRACGATSSYHCPSPIMESKIQNRSVFLIVVLIVQ